MVKQCTKETGCGAEAGQGLGGARAWACLAVELGHGGGELWRGRGGAAPWRSGGAGAGRCSAGVLRCGLSCGGAGARRGDEPAALAWGGAMRARRALEVVARAKEALQLGTAMSARGTGIGQAAHDLYGGPPQSRKGERIRVPHIFY